MKEKILLVLIGLLLGMVLNQPITANSNDGWKSHQVQEAINLLRQIAER